MDRFTKEDEKALDALLKRMNPDIGLGIIDYDKECVWITYRERTGSGGECVSREFKAVNTAMESVPCAIYEVVKSAFLTFIL